MFADRRANRQRAFYVPLLSFLPLMAQAAVLLLGGRMVVNGTLSFGEFVAFNVFVVMLVMPLRMLGMWIGQIQRATASGERIFEVIDEPEDDHRSPMRSSSRPVKVASVRGRLVRVRPGRPVLRGSTWSSRPADGRAHRAHRLGQDDARLPRPSLLRRHRGPGDHRR